MTKSLLRISAILAAVLLPLLAYAAIPSEVWVNCGDPTSLDKNKYLPGCGPGFIERLSGVLTILLVRLPVYVYILAVLFIMIGGMYILLSAGDTEKITKGKNAITWAVIGVFVMQFAEDLVGYVILEVTTRDAAPDLVESVVYTLIGSILNILYVALLGVAIYCGMRMVASFGKEDEFKKAREGLFWCAVGAILINLADAIANAVQTL